MKKIILTLCTAASIFSCKGTPKDTENKNVAKQFEYAYGGIVRGDINDKKIAIVFTSDGYYDGYETIKNTLQKHNAKGSFFFTGNAYRLPEFEETVNSLKAAGHYLGAHSDKHLLYCAWEKRDSLLVTKEEYIADIENNYAEMEKFGISKTNAPYYLPAFEYYNDTISAWTAELGLQLVNFTGGTGSNADYTTPDMGNRYRDSQTLFNNILKFEAEKSNGLNGFMLLIHFGVDPHRTDKLYDLMDDLMTELEKRGYSFVNVIELLHKN
jgi:peptidoglycan/xylan/chitin deacetylase (PgdA/CDA1 family)